MLVYKQLWMVERAFRTSKSLFETRQSWPRWKRQLKKGDKSLVGNKGYRRFLVNPAGGGFAIGRAKVEEDAKFDGVFVLRTNARSFTNSTRRSAVTSRAVSSRSS